MARVETADESDLQALERFVIENDDLLALEEAIGRFNIFDALRIERAEIRHSNFLAWLLSPNESHGQGDLFLKALMMDLLRQARQQGRSVSVSALHLDGLDLHGAEIRREHKHIDLLLVARDAGLVVAIENKVDADEHGDQLGEYKRLIRDSFPDLQHLFVFLAAGEQESSDAEWLEYGYDDLFRTLARVRRASSGSMGSEVQVFLDHYLALIERSFMNNSTIEELCRRIVTNHRRAIELLSDYVDTPGTRVLTEFTELLHQSELGCVVVRSESQTVHIAPTVWLEHLPPISVWQSQDPRAWIVIRLGTWKSGLYLQVRVGQTSDTVLRNRVVEELTKPDNEFGFKLSFKKSWRNQKRIALWTDHFIDDLESSGRDARDLAEECLQKIRSLLSRLTTLPDKLAQIAANATNDSRDR